MGEKSNVGGNTAVESKENIVATPVKKSPSKGKSAKPAKNLKSKATHPKTSIMVQNAIKELKDRKGSSFQAIKKYIASTYNVDGEKLSKSIKKYLKTAVISGAVMQTTGKGASGSFKLSAGNNKGSSLKVKPPKAATELKKQKKTVEKKTTSVSKPAAKKPSRSPTKKSEATKKPAATKSKSSTKVAEKVSPKKVSAKSKTISKSKKTAKAPAAKTRTPKPKKAATTKAVKAAAKK